MSTLFVFFVRKFPIPIAKFKKIVYKFLICIYNIASKEQKALYVAIRHLAKPTAKPLFCACLLKFGESLRPCKQTPSFLNYNIASKVSNKKVINIYMVYRRN